MSQWYAPHVGGVAKVAAAMVEAKVVAATVVVVMVGAMGEEARGGGEGRKVVAKVEGWW